MLFDDSLMLPGEQSKQRGGNVAPERPLFVCKAAEELKRRRGMPAASNYRIIMDFGASSRIDAGCADGWGVSFAMLLRTAVSAISLRDGVGPSAAKARGLLSTPRGSFFVI